MSVSTFMGLQTALRGVLAHQESIDTTSHNVANANTEGYSRQEAVMSATAPLRVASGLAGMAMIGSGVSVDAFRRIRTGFLDLQYRAQAMQVGDQETRARQLDQVEMGLAEPSDTGIARELSKFWNGWADLTNSPDDPAARQALIDQAKNLAAAFKGVDTQLTTVKTQTLAEYNALTGAGGDVEVIATEIGQLNSAIKGIVDNGGEPNDLMDRRDLLLDKLSKLAQVSVTDLGNGSINVKFGDAAVDLVSDTTVTWPQALTTPGGQLGALIDISKAGGVVDQYRTDLNAVVKTLADAVNTFHNPGGTGTDFFTYGAAGTEAGTLAVNVTTATVRTTAGGSPGGNDIALQIANLRGGTADSLYTAFVTRIGGDVKSAERGEANSNTLLGAIEDRRQSTSGVSMDEEMTNLVRFQRGYQASARVMSTMDQMLDTLINRTGTVGL
ncbi:MAG: flagellar hook-associated protein 1 [Thermoleophilaceae bacterium]|jgi:flagellar hook-associated protein 1 FlgK|nr:flagellar hook-associated protein 1 [Thermoleophilaceae bacterium]